MWDTPSIRKGSIGGYARSALTRCLGTLTNSVDESGLGTETAGVSGTQAVETGETTDVEADGRAPEVAGDDHWRVEASHPVYLGKSSVLDALEENGGRLWQRELVEVTDRPSSTVSRWLCTLEETGAVERIQIGREKLVFLPEHEPEVARTELPEPA